MTHPHTPSDVPHERRVFANRTLNLRSIKAVGCDMDYTLIHYRHDLWEQRAYEHTRLALGEAGWPVDGLVFDPDFATRGLVVDLELGNLVKATRFGYVTRACHGTRMLAHEEQRAVYARILVDLSAPRWLFLNTLFSLSEACLYAQLIDRLDAGEVKLRVGYREVYEAVRASVDNAHMEGALKAEIMRDPDTFVVPDPELPLALLDLKHSGKVLMLITNSEWSYTQQMMTYAFDRHLPKGQSWRNLFDIVIVEARKPAFFTAAQPFFEVMEDTGLLKAGPQVLGGRKVFYGGNARSVEKHLALTGEEILYIGDHVYADVHVTKDVLRWRTALIVRELEQEIAEAERFRGKSAELRALMASKSDLEAQQAASRLALQRMDGHYGPVQPSGERTASAVKTRLQQLREELTGLDARLAVLAKQAGELGNQRWGPLLRAGNDKSRMARQLERYADIYTSRVSNLLHCTPFAYLRPGGSTLPHDQE